MEAGVEAAPPCEVGVGAASAGVLVEPPWPRSGLLPQADRAIPAKSKRAIPVTSRFKACSFLLELKVSDYTLITSSKQDMFRATKRGPGNPPGPPYFLLFTFHFRLVRLYRPWHCLYLRPLPQKQGSLRPILAFGPAPAPTGTGERCCVEGPALWPLFCC